MNKYLRVISRSGTLQSVLAVLGSSLLCMAPVHASNMLTINIQGTVFTGPACVITGNAANRIDVGFGTTVRIDMIDGINYQQPIPFTVSCTGSPTTLSFKFSGNPGASFDPNVLATNINDLGVRLLKPDGTHLNLNEVFDASVIAAPNFMAVPVKATGANLPTGAFGASATLTVDVI